ncbi:MAG TPA: hemolysin III family protein, partial [Gemmatimonadaceae bacterium]|nr:hemolysin III family protein [Gemmatimonadaceae bacterium]
MKVALGIGVTNRAVHTLEELANVATHGLGLAASVVALPLFILLAARAGDTLAIVGVAIFGTTLVAVYAASTCYHVAQPGPRKEHWRRLDQAAVYLLIAGTYTPFSLGVLRGPLGWALLAIIWLAAFGGIAVKVGLRVEAPRLENAAYLGMGWLILVARDPLIERIGWAGLAWLVGGGVAYTV